MALLKHLIYAVFLCYLPSFHNRNIMALLKLQRACVIDNRLLLVSIIEILWLYWSSSSVSGGTGTDTYCFHNRNIMALLKLIKYPEPFLYYNLVSIIEILWLYWSNQWVNYNSGQHYQVSIIEILWLYWSMVSGLSPNSKSQ